MTENPADADQLRPADDSGDHLHPNTTGQQAMANSLDLHSPAFAQELTFFASAPGGVGGTVPATLSLALGAPAAFGAFVPGIAADYVANETATVTSSAGDATLTVADPSATATGHLVNGTFALPQALQVNASSPGGSGSSFAPVGGSATPTSVLTYSGPVANDPVTIGFRQSIGAGDALRTGSYAKTLTFTLSTVSP